ncbi:hypothetical protein Cni_G08506 [Canna indica]|uniref:SOSEKI DIX-like domain-containing protein n=1 Tax=Canna indica TaxID=4628 RepID=A0AAQ3K2I8_9LILI|nr:hypothetical protein Cni_G08506 [Canna indica]
MRRQPGQQTSPDTTKPPLQQQGRRVSVVYYLSKNGHLEHPHFIDIPLASPDGLFLKDVIDRLTALRGKGMAAMYSWSCKRGYKNGFVWHDIEEDDMILPSQGGEYVLKGSELLDQSPPDRNQNDIINPRMINPADSGKDQEVASSSSSMAGLINEAKNSLGVQSPVLSAEPGCRTPPNLRVKMQDASTQTDEQRGRQRHESQVRIVDMEFSERRKEEPAIVEEESSPNTCSSPCGRASTLESLIRDEFRQRNGFRIVEEEHVFAPARTKLKTTDLLVQLITCGSISVKDHYTFGIVPTYKPRFTNSKSPSPAPVFSGSIMPEGTECLSQSKRVVGLSGSIVETKTHGEVAEQGSSVERSPCNEEGRDERHDFEKEMESTEIKCLSRVIKIASCKQSRIGTVRSPGSG